MWRLSTYFDDEGMLFCWNQLQLGSPWSSWVSTRRSSDLRHSTYCQENSCLYIITGTVVALMSSFFTSDNRSGFLWHVDTYVFGYLLRTDLYVSNQYILDRNPRLLSYMIGVTYSDYISLLLVCSDFPLTSKRGVCWNLIPDSLDQVESQIDSNTIYYFEFQTWNLALQPA